MRILFELTHPKHYYQFRQIMHVLKSRGCEIKIIARDKDVLLKLLDNENHRFEIYGKHKKGLAGKIFNTFSIFGNYLKIVKRFKPDYIVSKASLYAVLIRPFTKAKLVITPDSEVVWLTRKIVAPGSHIVITPETYKIDYGKKQRRINGFFEECYLGPSVFNPDKNVLKKAGIDPDSPYFVLRFISWDANHDIGQFGFKDDERMELAEKLSEYGRVIISAEQKILPEKLKNYQNPVPPNEMHHLLHYAEMYIGDSQTMATESALLGTPSLRYNSFVGPDDMSNFIILEKDHGLLKNFSDFSSLLQTMDEMLKREDLKKEWLEKRDKYFSSKADLNEQLMQGIIGE